MELKILIILHILAACVWVGGHLVLSITVLPKAWKKKDASIIKAFEEPFEKIGIPSLLIQVITGFRLAMLYLPFSAWFDFSNTTSKLISFKLILLVMTIILAIHARFFIIPRLTNNKIGLLGIHIIAVTMIGILLLLVGLSFRLDIIN